MGKKSAKSFATCFKESKKSATSLFEWVSLAKQRVLPSDFFARPTLTVARELLGKQILVEDLQGVTLSKIVETEAYQGDDPASHSSRGQTPRNSPMFEEPGKAYVYFIYGMYEMLNFVTEPIGNPGAVLIRGVEPLQGEALMASRRVTRGGRQLPRKDWTNGPGRLTQALGIEMSDNRASLQGPRIWILEGEEVLSPMVSPRVGIGSGAGTDSLWRFSVKDNPFVSRAPQNKEMKPWDG